MPMTISIDDELKESFSETCREIGLTPSAAFGLFAKAVVREQRIPFELSAISSAERRARESEKRIVDGIQQGVRDVQEGRVVSREEARRMFEQMK